MHPPNDGTSSPIFLHALNNGYNISEEVDAFI